VLNNPFWRPVPMLLGKANDRTELMTSATGRAGIERFAVHFCGATGAGRSRRAPASEARRVGRGRTAGQGDHGSRMPATARDPRSGSAVALVLGGFPPGACSRRATARGGVPIAVTFLSGRTGRMAPCEQPCWVPQV
jgi:hypothetical protein